MLEYHGALVLVGFRYHWVQILGSRGKNGLRARYYTAIFELFFDVIPTQHVHHGQFHQKI